MIPVPRSAISRIARLLAAVILAAAAVSLSVTSASALPGNAPSNSSPAYFNSPVGRISAAENTYLHTHPVLIRHSASATPDSDPSWQNFGYWCAYPGGDGCANNWGRGGAGNDQKYYQCPECGKDGQYNQWYYGQVTSSFPWGTSYNLYTHYKNNAVYAYCWAPNGDDSTLCLNQENGAGGTITIEPSNNSLGQLWVWDGDHRWVAALVTLSSYINGNDTSWYAGYGSHGVSNGEPMQIEVASSAAEWFYVNP